MIAEQVRLIVAKAFDLGDASVTDETRVIEDLDESLELATAILLCEEYIHVSIPDDESVEIQTIGDLITCVRRHAPTELNVWPPPADRVEASHK